LVAASGSKANPGGQGRGTGVGGGPTKGSGSGSGKSTNFGPTSFPGVAGGSKAQTYQYSAANTSFARAQAAAAFRSGWSFISGGSYLSRLANRYFGNLQTGRSTVQTMSLLGPWGSPRSLRLHLEGPAYTLVSAEIEIHGPVRTLTPGEMQSLADVAARLRIVLARITIRANPDPEIKGFRVTGTTFGPYNIQVTPKLYAKNYAGDIEKLGLLAHELAHTWAFSGGSPRKTQGPYAYGRLTGGPLKAYTTEQQGEVVRGYFLSRQGEKRYKAGRTFRSPEDGGINVIGTPDDYNKVFNF
jgi:hypothetical protein